MPVTTGIAIFFLIWWIVLFAVLPWGVRSRLGRTRRLRPAHRSGAPAIPNLRRKLVWTTLVSVVIFAACYVIYVERLITLEGLLAPFGLHMTQSSGG